MHADLAIFGFSPASIGAALQARAKGMRVDIVDEEAVGLSHPGRHFANRLLLMALSRCAGGAGGCGRDVESIHREVEGRVGAYVGQIVHRLANAGVGLHRGPVPGVGREGISLGCGRKLGFDRLLIAVDMPARRPHRFPFDEHSVVDPGGLLSRPSLPRTCIVVGVEGEGVELASVLADLGTKVTLIDRRARMLRALDWPIANQFKGTLLERGVDIVLEDEITSMGVRPGGPVVVSLASGRTDVAEVAVIAAGRSAPGMEMLRKAFGLPLNAEGFLEASTRGATRDRSVWAVGGSVGVQAGIGIEWHMGRAVVDAMTGSRRDVLPEWIPIVWASRPAIGSVGLSEEAYRRLGIDCVSGRAGAADAVQGTWRPHRGFLKLLATAEGALVGAQMIGGPVPEVMALVGERLEAGSSAGALADAPWQEGTGRELVALAAADIMARIRMRHAG